MTTVLPAPTIAIAGQHPDRRVAEVHRAALAGAAAGALAEELGHRGPRRHALGERVAVRPVRGGDPVGRPEHVADADGDRLLALVLVERPRDLALEEEVVDRLLEAADQEHLPVQPGEVPGQAARPLAAILPDQVPHRLDHRRLAGLEHVGRPVRADHGVDVRLGGQRSASPR